MKSPWKRILPILLVIVIIFSIGWYLFEYDRDFTRDMLLRQARLFESGGNHGAATWLYHLAYRQSKHNTGVALELSEQFRSTGNYTKAEYTLSSAIADGGTPELYTALCKLYVEQDKLLDAVAMLDGITDPKLKAELDALRPQAPTASPAPGFYSQYITVTLAGTGKLYASVDQEYPSIHEDACESGSVTLVAGENTIYALSIGENGLVSPLSVFGYTVGGVIEEVKLTSPALEATVREMLGLADDAPIYTDSLWPITTLTMPENMESYSDLQYFPYLTSLTISGAHAGLESLNSLALLSELTVTDSSISAEDLTVIAALPSLSKLTLADCGISSIRPLSAAKNLTYLDLSNNTVRDISPISEMKGLQQLNLGRNALTDLSSLSGLQQLSFLDVSYNSLATLAPISGCTELTRLNASNNGIGIMDGVESLTKLTQFNISHNNLTECGQLSGLTGLTELDVSNNTLLSIDCLSSLVNLQMLDFSYNEVTVLPQWPTSCALVLIDGSYNKLTSVEPLSGYENLNTVRMDYNEITSVASLASCYNLIQVDVNGNPVTDVSALTEHSIIVNYTPVV